MEQLKDVSKEELIKRFVSDEFNRFLNYYKNAPDLNVENRSMERGHDKSGKAHSRFFISIGLMDGLDKGQLLRFVCDTTNLEGSNIGRIELKHSFSFFEVESELEDILVHAFKDVTYRGRKVKVELSTNRGAGGDGEQRGGGYQGKRKFYRNENRGEGGGGYGGDRKKKFFKRRD
jgi:ATP-dependent RNA helicase DeaD